MKKFKIKTAFVVFDNNHRMLNIYPDKFQAEQRIDWLERMGNRNLYFREIIYTFSKPNK
jgi:hypothetical protein